MSSRAKQLMGGILIASAVLIATSIEASAHTGTVKVEQDCHGGSASVALGHNVTTDRSVDVVSTIPGTSGFTGHHYGHTYGQIWDASWPTPRAGKVTLNIYRSNGSLEFTESKTLQPVEDCIPPTTTTTVAPTTTTTKPEVTTSTTTIPATTTTVPTQESTTSTTVTSVPASSVPGSTSSTTTTPKRIVQIGTPTSIAAPPNAQLPHTGSSSLPLAVGAFAALIVGSFFISITRNRKAAQ